MIATASDLRLGTPRAKVAFLFTRVGLAGCDMGACAMLPRIIGQGRAAELLYTGRSMGAEEAERWGFFNRLADPSGGRGGGARGVAGRRAELRARDDQDDARPGVGHVACRPRSRPRPRRRRSACRPRTSSGPTARSWPRSGPSSRATEPCSSGPSSSDAPPRVRGVGGAGICREVPRDDARRALPRARARARARRLAAARRRASRSTCARCASRARRSPTTTRSPTSPSPCRGSAAGRSRSSARRRSARATCPRSPRARRSRRSRCRSPTPARTSAAMTTPRRRRPPQRHQDLDLQRRDRRLLHRLRARARGHQRVRRRRRATSRSPSAST